ncbi:MAG: T9SS type A sorting domain-containing protein [Bacteroidia bacterium]|nr:T9SS type A sorting domain-containing protein [Bacteroidia bacterium]
MKKVLFAILLFVTSVCQAQFPLTLNHTNMPLNATRQISNQVLKLDGFVTPMPGNNALWNYGTAPDSNFTTGNYTYAPANDPAFPTATRQYNLTQVFAGFPVTSTVFEETNSDAHLYLGFKVNNQQKYTLVAKTGNPADSITFPVQTQPTTGLNKLLDFPVTAGTSWTNTYSIQENFLLKIAMFGFNNAPGYRKSIYNVSYQVVGWGSMRVPTSNGPSMLYSVLMVNITQSRVDSFYINGAPAPPMLLSAFGLTQGATTISYNTNFYRNTFQNPFFSMVMTDGTFSVAERAEYDKIQVNAEPMAIQMDSTATACPGELVQLTAMVSYGVEPYSFQWNLIFGGGSFFGGTETSPAPIFEAPTQAGTSIVEVIATDNVGQSVRDTIQISVQIVQNASLAITGPSSICPSSGGTLTAVGLNPSPTITYVWRRNGNIVSGSGRTLTIYSGGTYTVRAIGCGDTSAISNSFFVHQQTIPAVTVSGNNQTCIGPLNSGTVLTATSTQPGVTYQWSRNLVDIPGATSNTYTAIYAGTYRCRATLNTCTSYYSPGLNVTALQTPNVTISSMGSTTICPPFTVTLNATATNTSGATYQWFRQSVTMGPFQPMAGETNPSLTTGLRGNYYVEVTNANGCKARSNTLGVFYNTGCRVANPITIYPNPAKSDVVIEAVLEGKTAQVSILSLLGIEVRKYAPETIEGFFSKTISVAGLPAGVYLIRIETETGNQIQRLVVE